MNAATIATLAAGGYLETGDPVVLLGDSGTGKSHLLIGIGMAACEQGKAVRYVTCAGLVNELAEAADCRPSRNSRALPSRNSLARRAVLVYSMTSPPCPVGPAPWARACSTRWS